MFSFFAFIENILPISFLLSIVGVLLSRFRANTARLKILSSACICSYALMLSGTLALLYA